MNNIESPEIAFLNKVHELAAQADKLIEKYTDTAAIIASLPAEMEFPNQQESYELASETASVLAQLKVAVVGLAEHSSEVNDKLDSAVAAIRSELEK